MPTDNAKNTLCIPVEHVDYDNRRAATETNISGSSHVFSDGLIDRTSAQHGQRYIEISKYECIPTQRPGTNECTYEQINQDVLYFYPEISKVALYTGTYAEQEKWYTLSPEVGIAVQEAMQRAFRSGDVSQKEQMALQSLAGYCTTMLKAGVGIDGSKVMAYAKAVPDEPSCMPR